MTVTQLDPVKNEVLEGLNNAVKQAEAGGIAGTFMVFQDDEGEWWYIMLGDIQLSAMMQCVHELQVDVMQRQVYEQIMDQLIEDSLDPA